jgi:hypothetical protein
MSAKILHIRRQSKLFFGSGKTFHHPGVLPSSICRVSASAGLATEK